MSNLRKCKITTPSGDVKIDLAVNTRIPFMTAEQLAFGGDRGPNVNAIDSVNYSLATKRIETLATTPANLVIKLDDADGAVDRYTLIGNAKSIITKSKIAIYYDNIVKDIIITPDLETLAGDLDQLKPLVGNTLKFNASSLGHLGRIAQSMVDKYPYEDHVSYKFNAVNSIPKTLTHIFEINGKYLNSIGRRKREYSDTESVYSYLSQGVQFISLGSTTALLGATSKVPLYRLISQDINLYNSIYVGSSTADDILIPLNF